MNWTSKIIICLLIINFLWTYHLSKEIVNPKRYYLVYVNSGGNHFVSHIGSNGTLRESGFSRPRWRLPDALKAKEVYPHLKIIDCATLKEVKE